MTNTLTEVRCPLTELITTMCAHCRGHELAPEHRVIRTGRASRPGTCASCGDDYAKGDRIARTAVGDHLHTECVA